MKRQERSEITRREFVRAGAGLAVALPVAPALLALACGSSEQAPPPAAPKPPPPAPAPPAQKPSEPAPPPPPPASAGGGKLVTEIAANATLVASLQYVARSAKPEQNCANCQFYTAQEGKLGKCQLFAEGLVEAGGWCASWAKKVAGA